MGTAHPPAHAAAPVTWHTLQPARHFVLPFLLIATLFLAGCGNSKQAVPTPTRTPGPAATAILADTPDSGPPTPPPFTATPGLPLSVLADLAAGKALMQAQCAACHALADAGISAASPPAGPALDHIGAHRSQAWLALELVNPCAHPSAAGRAFQCSQMPSFADLTQAQRDQVVRYLLSRR